MEERKKKCSDKMPLRDFPVAMAYVPWQYFKTTYELDKALETGTIFPELDKPFLAAGRGCGRC